MEVPLQKRSTLCCGGAAPVPVKVSAAEFEELLVNELIAEALPDICGENVSVNGTLRPAAIGYGNSRAGTLRTHLSLADPDGYTAKVDGRRRDGQLALCRPRAGQGYRGKNIIVILHAEGVC